MHVEFDQRLRLPVDRAFSYIADPRHRPQWQSSLTSVQMRSEGPPHVGMRWREQPAPLVEFEMEIVELEPHDRWTERGRAWLGTVQVAVHFRPDGEDTRLRVEIDMDLRWFAKPLEWAARWALPAAMRADLRRVEELAERGPVAA
jgi:uncharacterized protein YndB with AHSA1/START domain